MTTKKEKGWMQKVSMFFSYLCFLIAAVCAGALLLFMGDASEVVRGSTIATAVFFGMVGFVLRIIGKADIPDFNPENTDNPDDNS